MNQEEEDILQINKVISYGSKYEFVEDCDSELDIQQICR